MKLTNKLLHSAGTSGRGFNAAQLDLLGVKSKRRGWLRRLIGTEISEGVWAQVVRLKGAKKHGKKGGVAFYETQPHGLHPPVNGVSQLLASIGCNYEGVVSSVRAGEFISARDHAQSIIDALDAHA